MHEAFTARWVAGWATSRRMPLRQDGSGWHVAVGSPSRQEEYVVAEPSPAEAVRFARLVAPRPASWLTVVGALGHQTMTALAPLDRIARVETVMERPITPDDVPEAEADAERGRGTVLEVDDAGDVAHVRIEIDGVPAARGQVARCGRDAVFDRIETDAAFRRRGLGRRTMAALTAWAAGQGADCGLLLASEQGRALYRSRGWRDVASASTFHGAVERPPVTPGTRPAGRPGTRP